MKVTIDIKDSKAGFFMELIKSLSFVKKVKVEEAPNKKQILAGVKQGVEEMKLIKAGKLKGRPVQELLDEL